MAQGKLTHQQPDSGKILHTSDVRRVPLGGPEKEVIWGRELQFVQQMRAAGTAQLPNLREPRSSKPNPFPWPFSDHDPSLGRISVQEVENEGLYFLRRNGPVLRRGWGARQGWLGTVE